MLNRRRLSTTKKKEEKESVSNHKKSQLFNEKKKLKAIKGQMKRTQIVVILFLPLLRHCSDLSFWNKLGWITNKIKHFFQAQKDVAEMCWSLALRLEEDEPHVPTGNPSGL